MSDTHRVVGHTVRRRLFTWRCTMELRRPSALPPECLNRTTVDIDRHRTLDQLYPDNQACRGLFGVQDAFDPGQGAMGDAYSHALDEIWMRVVAELVGDQCSDGLDLLLGDMHRLSIVTHQAGDTDRR